MNKAAVILLRITLSGELHWLYLNDAAEVVSADSYQDYSELPSLREGESLIVLLPGQHVLMTELVLPKMRKSALEKAIPFALEDLLLGDLEKQNFYSGKPTDAGKQSVAVVEEQVLNSYREALSEQGLLAFAFIPDFLALQAAPGAWSIAASDGVVLVRMGEASGFPVEVNNLPLFVELLLAQADIIEPSKCRYAGLSVECVEKLQLLFGDDVEMIQVPAERLWDISLLNKEFPVNLQPRQHRPKVKSSYMSYFRQPWKVAGLSFALLLIIIFSGRVIDLIHYKVVNHRLQLQEVALYHKIFPGQNFSHNARSRVQHKLSQMMSSGRSDDFMVILSKVGLVLRQHSSVRMASLEYQNKQLTITCSALQLASLEKFGQALTENSLHIKNSQISTTDKRVVSTLVLVR